MSTSDKGFGKRVHSFLEDYLQHSKHIFPLKIDKQVQCKVCFPSASSSLFTTNRQTHIRLSYLSGWVILKQEQAHLVEERGLKPSASLWLSCSVFPLQFASSELFWWSCDGEHVLSGGRCAWSADHTRGTQTSSLRCESCGGVKAHRNGQTFYHSLPNYSWTVFHLCECEDVLWGGNSWSKSSYNLGSCKHNSVSDKSPSATYSWDLKAGRLAQEPGAVTLCSQGSLQSVGTEEAVQHGTVEGQTWQCLVVPLGLP